MVDLRRSRFAAEAVDYDLVDRLGIRRRDVGGIDPEAASGARSADEAAVLDDRVGAGRVRVVEEEVAAGASLELLQCHAPTVSS